MFCAFAAARAEHVDDAITNLTVTITDNTYTAHWTPTSRCADTPITIAA